MHSYFSCYLWSEMLLEVNGKNLVVVHVCVFMSMCWETFTGMTPEGATSFKWLCFQYSALFDAVMQCLSLNTDVYGMAI